MQALRAQKSRVKVLYLQILDLPAVSRYTRAANRQVGPVSEAFCQRNGTNLCRLYGTATKASLPSTVPRSLGGELSKSRLRVLFRQLGNRALEQAKTGAQVAVLVPKGLGSALSDVARKQGQVSGLTVMVVHYANSGTVPRWYGSEVQSVNRKSVIP